MSWRKEQRRAERGYHHGNLKALASGKAAEHFARMVATLGGPADVMQRAGLARAPVQRAVPAPRSGVLTRVDTRA